MRRIVFIAFLLCFFQAYAKTPPIPEALLNAKTAVVANRGADDKDFNKLCERLKDWGRFELVQNQKDADIVIRIYTRVENQVVQMPNPGNSGGVNTIQVPVNYIEILDARNGAELWTDKTSGTSKDPRQLVNKLKSKMKKK
jgi:hypothetical protein